MELLLSHQTALAFWRNAIGFGHSAFHERNRKPYCAPCDVPEFDISAMRRLAREGDAIHLLVSAGNARIWRDGVTCHVQSCTLPPESVCKIGRVGGIDLYTVSPELCFLQMGGETDWIEHLQIGFELCGTYRTNIIAGPSSDTRYNVARLATTESLLQTATALRGAAHSQQAARSCRFILDNSASPAETALALMLTLPNAKGGYGLPQPQLNPEKQAILRGNLLNSQGDGAPRARRHMSFRPDLYWPSGRVAVEYDSRAFHSDPESMTSNAIRYNDLQDLNLTAFIATAGQLRSVRHSDRLAQQIGKALGFRLRIRCKDFRDKQLHLRHQLGFC